MRTTCFLFLSFASLLGTAQAQRLAAYDQITTAVPMFSEMQPPVPILPLPLPPVAMYPAIPALPPFPGPVVMPPGDSSFDNRSGLHWFTNGAIIASMPTPTFPSVIPPTPAFPIPLPVLAAIGGGPVTGLAISPIGPGPGPILYLCGAPGIVIGCTAVPGMPVVVPPFPIPFGTGPVTGLEWDGGTGSLWACDAPGTCYNFSIAGAPLAAPVPSPFLLPAPAGDVAIDKTLRLNGLGVRPLYITAGGLVFEVTDPAAVPFPNGLGLAQGLAFLDHPAANPPVGACMCPATTYPVPFTTGPMSVGSPWGIGVGGMPPGWPVLFAFDFAFLPGFPLVNAVGCGLGLTALPVVFGGVADPAGNAVLTLALVPPTLPLGAGPFYNQNFTLCPADTVLGLVLTPTQVVHVDAF